jgi:hypothetical protein
MLLSWDMWSVGEGHLPVLRLSLTMQPAVRILMRRQRVFRHLAQVRGLLCRRSEYSSYGHIAHLGCVCCSLGFLVGLHWK